jgi:hypothetical protein
MSDVSVALDSLKISDDDELPKFEDSDADIDVGPNDSTSKISVASSTREVQNEILMMAMKKHILMCSEP